MNFRLVRRLIADKLLDRTTYYLALFVGTLISAYGQLLVPWLRSGQDPFALLYYELVNNPGLTLFTVFLAYAFPFCVGIYSAVAVRYKNRRVESIADFPERKPDPVFRVTPSGDLVEAGAATRELFQRFGIDRAQEILGEAIWQKIVSSEIPSHGTKIYFEPEDVNYLVSHARTADGHFNIYLSRLPQ